jgi:hypothetical protein
MPNHFQLVVETPKPNLVAGTFGVTHIFLVKD